MDAMPRPPIKAGCLKIIDPENNVYTLKGQGNGPEAAIRITDKRLLRRLMVVPDLYLGEGYMDGTLKVEDGTLYDVLDFCAINLMPLPGDGGAVVAPPVNQNVIGKAQPNVAHHYDLNRVLFELFLNSDPQYSCAYFARDGESLEDAQANKKRRLAAKLLLKPGMRVLDIGSGYGGLALELARTAGVEVAGVTLSEEQWKVGQERARAAGLEKHVTFKLIDYREESGRYDRIVSVGMFENTWAAAIMASSSVRCVTFLPTTASPSCTRSAAWRRPARPSFGLTSTSFRAAIRRRCRKPSQRSSERGSGSRMSRSSGSITLRRSRSGTGGSNAIATGRNHFTTSASAACGSSISRSARSRSGV